MALRFPGKAISGPPNPRLAIPSPREMEPLTPDPRPERSVHRGVKDFGAEALEIPTALPEDLAGAQVGDAPGSAGRYPKSSRTKRALWRARRRARRTDNATRRHILPQWRVLQVS